MSTSAISLLALLVALLGGGGNDLLDYLPTESYWRAKGVTISVEAMLAELKPVADQDISAHVAALGSPDPAVRATAEQQIRAVGAAGLQQLQQAAAAPSAEVAGRAKALLNQVYGDLTAGRVRRLMVVRTLGELGDVKAMDALRPLLRSDEPFMAEYAAAAVARIEKKPYARPRPAEAIAADVWRLPESCRAVAQVAPRGVLPLAYADTLAAIKAPDGVSREEMLDESTSVLIALAEQLGNVRLDSVTVGVHRELTSETGFVVAVVRGRYDAGRLKALLKLDRTPARRVEGVEVFEPTGEIALLLPSDEVMVVLAAPRPESLPLQPMIAAFGKAGPDNPPAPGLKSAPEMVKLIGTLDTTQPVWAAVQMTDIYRQLPLLSDFTTLTLSGKQSPGALHLTLQAQGRDPLEVTTAVQRFDKQVKGWVEFLRGIRGIPLIDAGADYLETVRPTADGTRVMVTATLKPSPAAVLALPVALEGGERAAPPAPAEPPKVQ